MSASEDLRAMLDDVAAGKVTPERATAAIARWMVLATGAVKDVPVEVLMRQTAGHVREEDATICAQVIAEYRAGTLHIGDWTADEAARRIRARGEALDQLPSQAPAAARERR